MRLQGVASTSESGQEQRPALQQQTGVRQQERQAPKRRTWATGFITGFLTVMLLASAALGGAYLWYQRGIRDQAAATGFKVQPVVLGQRVNFLVLGMDDSGLRSDTLMVVSFDPATRDVGILSIPRDSRVRISTDGPADLAGLKGTDLGPGQIDKINAATAYQTRELSGIARSQRTVEDLLGVPINYYVKVRLSGFVSLVNRLGGIDFNVPQNMNYDDPYQGLHIHLQKGMQHLTGLQVMELARYRGYYGSTPDQSDDLARIQVQHDILKAILDKMESTGAIANLPGMASDLAGAVDTNLPASKLVSLALAARGLSSDQFHMATLPGQPVGPGEGYDRDYYLPDMKAAQPLIQELLKPSQNGPGQSEARAMAPDARPIG